MPFDQLYPRSFNAAAVREHAPARPGVYGLSNARRWVFIGESDNVQETLLGHLRESDTPLQKEQPTGFVFEICDRASQHGRQDRLIQEYGPTCNRQGSRYK